MSKFLLRLRASAAIALLFSTFSVLSTVSVAAAAADQPDDEIVSLVVVGSRVTTAATDLNIPVELISPDDIERRQASYLQELLTGRPGFAMTRSGGVGALSELRLRGSEANHTLVLIDGVDANDPALGSSIDLSHLRLTGTETVEVLRGPQSALWGSAALAGVINIRTFTTAPTAPQGGLMVESGSLGTQNLSGHFANGNGNAYLGMNVSLYRTDGINISTTGSERDGYDNRTWHLHTGYQAPDWRIGLVLREIAAETQFDPTVNSLPVDGDRESHVGQRYARAHAELNLSANWQHSVAVNYMDTDNNNYADGSKTNSSAGSKTRYVWQQNWWPAGRAGDRFTLALERSEETFAQRGTAQPWGDPNQNQSIFANSLVLEYDLRAGSNLGFTLSGRGDRNSDFRNAVTGRAALRYDLPEWGSRFFASLGNGIKNPTFTQRFGFTPNTFIGNPDLKPQQSVGVQLGVEQTLGNLQLGLTLFNDRLKDEIDGFVFDMDAGAFTAANKSDYSHRRGIEVHAEQRLTDNLRLQLAYGYLHATEPDANNRQTRELRRPRNTGRMVMDWQASTALHLQLGGAYVGSSYDNNFSTWPATRETLNAYWLVNLNAAYQLSPRSSLFGRVENALDTSYQNVFGYQTPGRTAHLGLRLQL